MNPSINIENLSIGHNNVSLISNINISSSSNKLIAVIGRNGKGKSTLLKTISGLLPPIQGNINFNLKNINKIQDKERAQLLSIVLSSNHSMGNITVNDFVAYGRYPYTNWFNIHNEEDDTIIKNALQLCQLEELSERYYHELSDGEKQKVSIARVLAQNTPLIVLDEPTAHLDLINKVEILKLLKELASNHNKMIIISTHQIELALQLCNEIWVLANDEIKIRTPEELLEKDELNTLFGNENIVFNSTKKSFEVK
ncbi:MAG: ABC transporter ATP-binding protein [Vicingus serpentipes]|nr:ABC transporter ATP-binding protein [Vicingus serpentipes]